MCRDNEGMRDHFRELFLEMHNFRRSNMALGKVRKSTGRLFPEAADMQKMVYDCDLEAHAMIYAETCALQPSYPGTRRGQGENVAVVQPSSAEDFTAAVEWAVRSWFRPVKSEDSIGVQKVTFRAKHKYTAVAHATQV
ncbi:SCP-like protein, partial [Ostertagia ostertagi]